MSDGPQGLIEFAIIALLVLIVVTAALVLLGPQGGACFCGVTDNLRVATPNCSC